MTDAFYEYVCDGCGRESTVPTTVERVGRNHEGIHVRCGECGTTNFARKQQSTAGVAGDA